MSIFNSAFFLAKNGVSYRSVAADSSTLYLENWIKLLASVKTTKYNTHIAHLTVKSHNFMEMHKFFQSVYEYLETLFDDVAEHIRALDITLELPNDEAILSSYSFTGISGIAVDKPGEGKNTSDPQIHLSYLHVALDQFISHLVLLNKQAIEMTDIAGQNFIGDMSQRLTKFRWFTRSYEPTSVLYVHASQRTDKETRNYIKAHMRALAQEIIAWKSTGKLKEGSCLSTVEEMLGLSKEHDGLRLAEDIVINEFVTHLAK